MWKLFCYLGVISLIHAAFSAAQHRSYRRLVKQEVLTGNALGTDELGANFGLLNYVLQTDLPMDIVLQAFFSCLLVLTSLIVTSGNFQEIRTLDDLNRKPRHLFDNQPSLYRFCHRGRILR